LVFSDAVWCKANLPDSVKAIFESNYLAMGTVANLVTLIERSPFELMDHSPLPPKAWWDDFYTLMQRFIEESRGKYANDPEVLEILTQLALNQPHVEKTQITVIMNFLLFSFRNYQLS